MAPERFAGAGDRRSDVYSLACVLHFALIGQAPFVPPAGALELGFYLQAHMNQEPPKSSVHGAERGWPIPAALDEAIACGMAKDPADRYRSAGALAEAAQQALTAGSRHERDERAPAPATTAALPAVSTRLAAQESGVATVGAVGAYTVPNDPGGRRLSLDPPANVRC
jgi:serine/threonine-protein kinase